MAQQRTEGQHRRPVRLQRRHGDAAPVIGEPDRRSRASDKLGEIESVDDLARDQPARADVDHREIGIYRRHHALVCELRRWGPSLPSVARRR